MIRALWQRIAGWFVRDVPPEHSACLGCDWKRADACTEENWDTCEARLKEASAVGPGGLRVKSGKLKVRR